MDSGGVAVGQLLDALSRKVANFECSLQQGQRHNTFVYTCTSVEHSCIIKV
jgi:hypothetical protein